LLLSIITTFDRYLFSDVLTHFVSIRIEESKHKFYPTEEDINPNTRLVDNRPIAQLESNKNLIKYVDQYKISWVNEQQIFRKFYLKLKESNDYKKYLSDERDDYEGDKEFLIKMIKKQISRFDLLHSYYEDKSIYWANDFHTANLMVIKTLKAFESAYDEDWSLPSLLKNDDPDDENNDKNYLLKLYRTTIIKDNEYEALIAEKAKNWEVERIAMMDMVILKMALAEIMEFPSIPVKVTMNEYIELAKIYSTPKSNIFVNGILDKLTLDLKTQEKIKKTGRGLME